MLYIECNGYSLSRLTLGTVQLGLPYGIANKSGQPDEADSFRILDEAFRGGINCFDTAIKYGNAERVLGDYFNGKEKPYIVSKMLLDIEPHADGATIERQVMTLMEHSLDRLQLNKIPVMMLHQPDVLFGHGQAVTNAFRAAVRQGYAECMGISFGAESDMVFREIWKYAREDVYGAVQIPVNVLDHRLIRSGALRLLGEAGKTVFARSTFLQGLLMMQPEGLPTHLREAGPYLHALYGLAEREGMTVSELAVAFVRDLPEVHSLVIGAETPEQVRANIALFGCRAIGGDMREEMFRTFGDVPDFLVSPQTWHSRK